MEQRYGFGTESTTLQPVEKKKLRRGDLNRDTLPGLVRRTKASHMHIQGYQDVVAVRIRTREMVEYIGFCQSDTVLIAAAVSEVAYNTLKFASCGDVYVKPIFLNNNRGVLVVAMDEGPGIPDVEKAVQVGYSTSGGLGLGLPGCRRIMDEFSISTEIGKGTTIRMKKWVR